MSERIHDAEASENAKQLALDLVEQHAPEEWRRAALDVVMWVAQRFSTFTVDQITSAAHAQGVPDPPEPRAWGPVLRRAQARGWIEPTGQFEPSTRVSCHRCPRRVWRSLA